MRAAWTGSHLRALCHRVSIPAWHGMRAPAQRAPPPCACAWCACGACAVRVRCRHKELEQYILARRDALAAPKQSPSGRVISQAELMGEEEPKSGSKPKGFA